MRTHRQAIVAAFSLAVLCATASGQTADPKAVKLKYQVGGRASSTYTPYKLLDHGESFRFGQPHGRIKVAGQELLIAGRYIGTGYLLGLDCNGDQKIGSSEWASVNMRTYSTRFRLRLSSGTDKHDLALRFVNVSIGVRANRVINIRGRYMIDGCMAGAFGEVPIGIFDDNLDGKYTQDGEDAIAIGSSPGAMPLWKHHQVGPYHYRLEVASDGSEITLYRVEHQDLGAVYTPLSPGLIRCLMLVDSTNERAYDVRASGRGGIPAGNYQLSYAVLSSGNHVVAAVPGAKALTYTIAQKAVNVLRFGPPCQLVFRAYYHGRDQQIRVRSDLVPYGTGGERYDMSFVAYHALGENPNVVLTNGRTVFTSQHMVYDSENVLREFAGWVPAGFTKKTGKIIVTCDLPVLGKAVGVRTLADVLDGIKPNVPDPKQPAVKTKKLPDGVALGKAPPPKPKPKPKPAPPPPRPKPIPRPTRPRVEDPEHDAATMLDVAKAFLKQGKKAKGVAKLKEIVKKYPKTLAAKQADDLLIDIEIADEPK
jgi:hypothetical protein